MLEANPAAGRRPWLTLPPLSAVWPVFATTSFVVQIWAFLNLLREVPALRLRLALWDLLGTMAYVQAFALLETTAVVLFLLALVFILPGRIWRDAFAGLGSGAILLSAVWAVALHLDPQPLGAWTTGKAGAAAMAFLSSQLVLALACWRWPRLVRLLAGVGRNLMVLALIYGLLGGMGVALVIVRNVGGA